MSDAASYTSFHHLSTDAALAQLDGSIHGLNQQETAARREHYGRNALPKTKPPGLLLVFLHQFLSPLIYVLGIAALVSLLSGRINSINAVKTRY